MRKEIIIRMQPDSDKARTKALTVAASVSGVKSMTVAGESRDILVVIGDGMDEGKLMRKLKKEVGEADILELRTLPGSTSSTVAVQSAYQRHPTTTPGRSVPGGGRIECPVAAAARWPGEHGGQAIGYHHHRTPSPGYYHHHQSSMVGLGHGGYGGYAGGSSSFALEVARSHPANYSPMIARHDFRGAGRPGDAGGRREPGPGGGGGGPNCCSIL